MGRNADLDLGWIISTDVWDEDGDTSVIDRYVPNPTFSVETLFDVWSSSDRWNHWPEGTPVEIVVDDDDDLGNGHKFVHETSVEWWGEAPWEAGFGTNVEPDEILPGDVVHVTIGDTTKVLHVQDITIDTVDEESDLVEGYATPGERVEVNVGNEEGGAHRSENADDDTGYWQANFSLPGDEEHEQDYWDIVPGTDVSAQVYDEDGDSTHRGFRSDEPALPSFSVRMSDQQVHGYEWSEGEPVSLEIDDPGNGPGVDYEADGWPEPAEWDSEQTFVWFGAFEDTGFEMFPGFEVTMTQGDVTKSHTVTDLVVTEVNSASDTVAGAATALGWIDVHIHDTEVNRTVQADGSGLWIADFSVPGTEDWEQEVHDIEPGTNGEANEPDEDGDSTQLEWHLAGLPEFGVSATHDWIEGYDFEGEEITFTVDDDDSPGNGVLHEETIYVDPGEPNWIYLIDGFDVEAGQFVTVTDGVTTKTTWVSPIEITEVDTVNWTVSGVADPDVVIDTFGFHPDVGGFGEHMIEVDGSGEWTLDLDEFFDPGDRPAEIPEGMLLGGGQRDDDSDRTIMFWDPAVVDGYVMAGGVPVVGGEVFFQGTIGAQHTCTDSTGYYRFENVSVVKALVSQGVAATGRAVNPDVACSNPDFVDDAGHPLVTAYVVGPFDLQDGYEHIPFDVVRAEAYQRVEVAEFDGADWLPADNVLVRAYDRNDPEFDATFGSDPDPEDYGAIWESGIGEFGLDFTGVYLLEDSGSVELRYPHLTDYLVLVEYVDGEILGQTSDAAEFGDDGAGVYVGPTLYFPAQPNTAPEIVSFEGPVDPYALGWEGFVTGEFVDPDAGDTFTVEVDWGDGTTTTPDYDFVGGVGSFDDSHFYTAAGIYTITLTVRDASGAEAIAEYDSAVVFDPNGKSISGSPQVKIGDVSDKINFNIKYNKKTGDPKGHLKYTHKVKSALENVRFRADEIDYMWIFGDWAATAGRGTFDSTCETYEFALVVFDGKNTGVDDMFRFKLWNAETGDVFYDSQPGDPLLAFPTTVPTQGSIKVK
ncbi:MAG: hypothetical protein GY788_00090 [bacterium]|nr:hypothetical protein [bacterium]